MVLGSGVLGLFVLLDLVGLGVERALGWVSIWCRYWFRLGI